MEDLGEGLGQILQPRAAWVLGGWLSREGFWRGSTDQAPGSGRGRQRALMEGGGAGMGHGAGVTERGQSILQQGPVIGG